MAEHEGGYDFYYATGINALVDALEEPAKTDLAWIAAELLRDPSPSNPAASPLPGLPGSMMSIKRGQVKVTFLPVNALVSAVVDIEVIADG